MTMAYDRSFGGRRILVTGGAGFVGSNVVARLAEAGARVTVLDDLFTGQADALPKSRPCCAVTPSPRRAEAGWWCPRCCASA